VPTVTLSADQPHATLRGSLSDEILLGTGGSNALFGGGGNDSIVGFTGNNWLEGGSGNDTISSGNAGDWMVGGGGSNVFVLHANNGHDVITDFVTGSDKLSFVNQAASQVSWHTGSQFGLTGIEVDHGSTWVFLKGVATLNATDFLFA
jgi:Ca2+-binding RTX toxin-like protein